MLALRPTGLGSTPHAQRSARGRLTAALAALLVLVVTGLSWWTTHHALGGFTFSQALGLNDPRSANGSMNILLIGLDSRKDQDGNDLPQEILDKLHAGDSDSGGYNTNTLILAHIRPDNHVVAVSIPRDDYIPVTGIPGYDHVKIKEAYGLKKADTEEKLVAAGITDQRKLENQGREAGRAATLAAVRDLTGVPIDYFAEVSLAGFYDLAATIGGIDVCLNQPVSDDYSGADFPAGPQTLDAAQALAFVRQRHGLDNGDLDRTRRQQAFLVSVMHKLRDDGAFTDFGKLESLINVAHKDVVLSAGWSDAQFRRMAQISPGDVEYHTLPVLRFDSVDGQAVNVIDPSAIKADVAAAFSDHATSTTPTSAPSSTVDVINAGSTEGLAARVSAELTQHGYVRGEIRNTNAGEPHDTEIDYGTGAAADAQTLAGLVGIQSPPRPDSTEDPGHIRVVLGQDFNAEDTVGGPNRSPGGQDSAGIDTPASTPTHSQALSGGAIPCVD